VTLLLDTHTFIWFDAEPAKLSARAAQLVADPNNRVLLSVASVWELAIKTQLGKLALRDAVQTVADDQVARNAIELLPVRAEHVYAVGALPPAHKDPFDRLLAAQAIVEGASLVTADAVFAQYPVAVEW
jgi:PIN domain nuclease of toxin-antitoxin system